MATIEVKDLDKQKKQLKASYEMWEKSIKDTVERMENSVDENGEKKFTQKDIDDRISLLKDGEQDVIDKWFFLGGTMEELEGKPAEKNTESKPKVKKKNESKTVFEQLDEIEGSKPKVKKINKVESPSESQTGYQNIPDTSIIPKSEESNPLASYDIIRLPSKGECYASKQGRIAVSYLTAIDENIIVSPNLYRDNMVLDIILKEKIRNSEIDADDLIDGDRDAIILFLRSSAYGNMYPVTAVDPDTKEKFDAEIDLSKIKYKEFNLIGDENGYFDYEMPISKDKIKFKFLTHNDYKKLSRLDSAETPKLRKGAVIDACDKLSFYLNYDKEISDEKKKTVTESIEKLLDWANTTQENSMEFSRRISNELEMSIMSVNGNTDRKYIHNYVSSLPIKDSSSIRKYIANNMPGVDYSFEIQKPQSLGGGSMNVFIQFDQFIFLPDSI